MTERYLKILFSYIGFAVFFIGLIYFSQGCKQVAPADLVLMNAQIATMEASPEFAEALAIDKDRLIAVGSKNLIRKYIGKKTRVLDLQSKRVIPGLIEGHAHFLGLGYAKMQLDLTRAANWDAVVAMVAEAVQLVEPGEWIIGRGWHQEKWQPRPVNTYEGYPAHDDLSRVSANNPVILTHASGHAIFVNKKAMDLAGINRRTPDPPGGRIIRRSDGEATGVFLETAEDLIQAVYHKSQQDRTAGQIEAETIKAIHLATEECLRYGITTFYDAGSSFQTIDLLKRLADENALGLRLWVMIGEENDQLRGKLSDYRLINYGNYHLTVRAIKRYMDGALGARGAWLLDAYEDLPGDTGLNTIPLNVFEETARLAIEHGFQVCTHAIGDRANRETLDIYGKVFAEYPQQKDLRWRIEHAQHLHPDDIPRFAELGVIAAMQTNHCTSDGPWVPQRLGEKRAREGAYVWQKLMQSGAIIANGTDAPVEDINPFANYYAAVTRKMENGQAFYPEQAMSRMEALISYTWNAAYAGFEEDIKGSIKPGKLADLVVLSQDLLSISEEKIPATEVLYTILGGKIVYQHPSLNGDDVSEHL